MTNALFDMKDAPRDGGAIIVGILVHEHVDVGGKILEARPTRDPEYPWRTSCGLRRDDELVGFLPLPADASSAAVAKAAGEWLSLCSDEDVAAVIREALKRGGVREALETASNWPEAKRHKAHAINNAFVAPVLRALAQEPSDD